MIKVRELKTYRTWLELTPAERERLRIESSIVDSVNQDISLVVEEIFNDKLRAAGIPAEELKKHWSLSSCQGDGCSVSGRIYMTTALLDRVGRHIDRDRIRRHLEEDGFLAYRIVSLSRHYVHRYTMDVVVHDASFDEDEVLDDMEVLGKNILSHIKNVCYDIEQAAYAAIEQFESDENISDMCEANGVLFDESGRPFWGLTDRLQEDKERFSELELVA